MSHTGGGVIVIFSPGWASLDQFALRIARCGATVRHVRLSEQGHPLRVESWVYPGHRAATRDRLADELRAVPASAVADILCPEELAAAAAEAAEQAGVPAPVCADLRRRATLADKGAWAAPVQAAGVDVPWTRPAEDVDLAAAPAVPCLVKPRSGAAGEGVAVLADATQLTAAVERARREPGTWILQQLLAGEVCQYVAAYEQGQVVLDGQYATTVRSARAFGPGSQARLTDDSSLRDVGRRTIAAIGGSGLINVETVKDRDGRHHVIDLNARPWALFGEFVRCGYPFDRAYLQAVGALPWAPLDRPAPPTGEERLDIFPPGLDHLRREGTRATLARTARLAPAAARTYGVPYTLLSTLAVADRIRGERRRSVHRAPAHAMPTMTSSSTPDPAAALTETEHPRGT